MHAVGAALESRPGLFLQPDLFATYTPRARAVSKAVVLIALLDVLLPRRLPASSAAQGGLSYRFFESRFLRMKVRFERGPAAMPALARLQRRSGARSPRPECGL